MEPRCFMHVPKSAGTSVRAALEQALPSGALGPKRQDATLLCGFTDFDQLEPRMRALLAVEPAEIDGMAEYAVVSGHFSLPTLLRVASRPSIATVLREPRARLLSHFAYWRLSSGLRAMWHGYPPLEHALRPLDEFLAEPQVAQQTDNLLCRMLLHGDPRIPELDFISEPEAIASDAIGALGTLGFVGVVELPDPMWRGLSSFFGVHLSPVVINTTASESTGSDAPALQLEITPKTLEMIDARVAADAIVYEHALGAAGCSGAAASLLATAAFASELFRLGDIAGVSASEARVRARQLERLGDDHREAQEQLQRARGDLERTREDLERHRRWIEGLTESVSWRITAPARAAKRVLKRLRAGADPIRRASR